MASALSTSITLRRPSLGARGRRRGVTLVEVLIVLAIMAIVTGTSVLGFGALKRARLRQSAIMVASAVRTAYVHASSVGKEVRLVFDFEQRMVILEEGTGSFAIDRKSKTGGAEAATDYEREAQEDAEKILGGPRAPRASFSPTKAFGFEPEKGKPGKELADGIRFLLADTGLEEGPIEEGRAYLYFWPGGQTQRAVIQLVIGNPAEADMEADVMTVSISPLTGKPVLAKGRVELKKPRDDSGESGYEDSSF